MTNQQGAPEAPSYEHQRAIMEGERNASLDAYSRVVYLTQTESRIYEAAFTNGWNRLAALVEAQQPAPSAAAAEQRRSDLVPGVMHCAKCKFQLNRVTLCVSDGNAYAGNNETEPCPNGCGPLWPVTWEQEARNCWKALEEMHERLHPAPTPQADSRPAPTHAQIAAYLEATGAYVTNDATREAAIAEAISADRAARAPADSVTAPAGGPIAWESTTLGYTKYITQSRYEMFSPAVRAWYKPYKCSNCATPPAQAADSVLEDAARLLRQILTASQDGDSDTHLSAHFVSRIETITKAGGAA